MSELQRFGKEAQISTYALRLRARQANQAEKPFGAPGFQAPPEFIQEAQYQEKLLAGYKLYTGKGKTRRKNVCETCFQVLNASGTCNCD